MKIKTGIFAGMAAVAVAILFRRGTDSVLLAPLVSLPSQPEQKFLPSESLSIHQALHRDDNVEQLPTVKSDDPALSWLSEQAEKASRSLPDQTASAWDSLISSFSEKDIPWILDCLVSAKGGALAELRQLLIRRWAGLDPSAAGAWAAGVSDLAIQKESLEDVAIVWCQKNPAEALAWAAQLSPGDGKTAVIISLGYEVARIAPVSSLGLAITLPSSKERDEMVVHGVSQWALANPSAAADWAVQIPDDVLRQRVMAAVGIAWASSDSVSAAAFALNHLTPGAEQDRVVVSIVQRWVQTEPVSTAKWIEQFPAVPVRYIALQNLVAIWAEQNPEAPVNWLRGLPSGALRDESISVYAQMLAPQSYQSAQIWAAAIEDSSLRMLCHQAIRRFAP
jgi:hypothetical protein